MVLCTELSSYAGCVQQGKRQSSRRGGTALQGGPSREEDGAIIWLNCVVDGEWDWN